MSHIFSKKAYGSSQVHLHRLDFTDYDAIEIAILMRLFQFLPNERATGDDYESALLNQTIYFKHTYIVGISKNRTRNKQAIDRFISEDIISSGNDSGQYIINPVFARNLTDGQVRFSEEIQQKFFHLE